MGMTIPIAGVLRYAERFHDAAGSGHHVASPLGAWLVLALAGPATEGAARAAVEDALGCDVVTAATAAAALFDDPHPLVAAAAAVWRQPVVRTAALDGWLSSLPGAVEIGGVPSQPTADDWARRNSHGLIEHFPLRLRPATALVLASALASSVTWHTPYELAPATELGRHSPWAHRLTQVLRAPRHGEVDQYIAATDRAGDVAVHTAGAPGGLRVTSVIAAPDVAPHDVLAVAHQLAVGAVGAAVTGPAPSRRSLFDLPLGDGPAWRITAAESPSVRSPELFTAVLPAWSADSSHPLLAERRLGFAAAGEGLISLLPPGSYDLDARQSAVARYDRAGFEAAAVSAIVLTYSAPPPGLVRTAALRFAHPYAVVAVAVDENSAPGSSPARSPWHGLPVFSAWITDPGEAH